MEIYQLIILDKLYETYQNQTIDLWELKRHLGVCQRIPKDKIRMVIAELMNESFLIKTDKSEFKLMDGIDLELEKAIKEYSLIRNRTLLE